VLLSSNKTLPHLQKGVVGHLLICGQIGRSVCLMHNTTPSKLHWRHFCSNSPQIKDQTFVPL